MVNIHLGFGHGKTVAVVDISPGGASVAILSTPKDEAATVRAIGRSAMALEPRTDNQAKTQIGEQVKEAAAQAMKLFSSAGHNDPITEAYVIVHAPWSTSTFAVAEESYATDMKIQATHIGALAKKSVESAVLQGEAIERSVIEVSLNGYPTAEPEGKTARGLRVLSVTSTCEASVRSSVEGAVHQSFPVAKVVWRSGLRSMMSLARQSHLESNFLIIDMGTDDTHIVSYRDGIAEQLTMPEGVRTILARVAAARPVDEVLGYVRMLAKDSCSSEACDALRQALAVAEPELVRIFGEAMAKISAKNRVPNGVFLVSHPDLESWLAAFLSRIDFAQFTVTSLPLAIHTPVSLDIGNWVAGSQNSDALTVSCALVNIESRS